MPDGTLMVPIANEETLDRQMETAIDLANDHGYRLLILHVVSVPPQIPISEGERLITDEQEALLNLAKEKGDEHDIPTETLTQIARDIGKGILAASDDHDVDMILLGWRGRPPRREVILGSYIDRVLRNTERDTVIKRIRTPTESISTILVPIASGPHNQLATRTAGALARENDASVTLLHVTPRDPSSSDQEKAQRVLEAARRDLGDVPKVEDQIVPNDDTASEVIKWTKRHDVTLVGATTKSMIQSKILGTVSNKVGRHGEGTVMIAQHAP